MCANTKARAPSSPTGTARSASWRKGSRVGSAAISGLSCGNTPIIGTRATVASAKPERASRPAEQEDHPMAGHQQEQGDQQQARGQSMVIHWPIGSVSPSSGGSSRPLSRWWKEFGDVDPQVQRPPAVSGTRPAERTRSRVVALVGPASPRCEITWPFAAPQSPRRRAAGRRRRPASRLGSSGGACPTVSGSFGRPGPLGRPAPGPSTASCRSGGGPRPPRPTTSASSRRPAGQRHRQAPLRKVDGPGPRLRCVRATRSTKNGRTSSDRPSTSTAKAHPPAQGGRRRAAAALSASLPSAVIADGP